MVVWIIGLSGAGKTTLADRIIEILRSEGKTVVSLDGDVVRETFGNDLGYTIADRRRNAERICRLGKLLDDQDILVVCPILSLFPESRAWNRTHLKNYYEIYIQASMHDLTARDSKGLYKKFEQKEIKDVAGMDLPFEAPESPDLIIYNDDSKDALLSHAKPIAKLMMESKS